MAIRHSHLTKKRNRVRPAVERLHDRIAPAITFAAFDGSTLAYNHGTNAWRTIAGSQPELMDEGADGTLFAGYKGGTWMYTYASQKWTRIAEEAREISAGTDNTLVASFSSGTWQYDGQWKLITDQIATELAVNAKNHFFGTYGDGTFEYKNGGWKRISYAKATEMDAAGGSMFGSFSADTASGTGTWKYNGTWKKVSGSVSSDIAAVAADNFWGIYKTGPAGLWHYNNGNWVWRSGDVPTQISADYTTPLMGSYTSGTWEFDGGWAKLTSYQARLLA